MKIRTDYVSNSSSSSFVLADIELFAHFGITKDDILDALVDAYGVEKYRKTKMHIMERVKAHPELYESDLRFSRFGPFWVYDLSIPGERKEAVSRWGSLLKCWTANNCRHAIKQDGSKTVELDDEVAEKYYKAIGGIADVYGFSSYELDDIAAGGSPRYCKRFVRTVDRDKKTNLNGRYEPISKELVNMVRDIRAASGVMTNLEVVKSKFARFFVHADDNELVCAGPKEDDPKWKEQYQTQAYTYDRVCEMLLDYLVKVGRVNLGNPEFLKKMKIDDVFLSKYDRDAGRLYYFCNGKKFSWEDIKNNSMTWCMHEG